MRVTRPADEIGWSADSSLARVLNSCQRGGAVSRRDIVRLTGLSRDAVNQRVTELIQMGLLQETGIAPSEGGRPPRRLRFSAAAGRILVADLGVSGVSVGVTDLGGEILAWRTQPADIADGPASILSGVEDLFRELSEDAPEPQAPLWGIGIAVPGPVDFGTGRPASPHIMPGWEDYPVRERFSERYSVPVWVDDDKNVLTLGERREGSARGCSDVVFVKLGSGIGAGIISHGRLVRGAHWAAGNIGHIRVAEDSNVLCRCGKWGCLEAIAGGLAIGREGTRMALEGLSPWLSGVLERKGAVTAEDVSEAAFHGDALCTALLQRAGRLVGTVLAALINIQNPSLVVIGGGMAGAGDHLLGAIREAVYGQSLPLATRDLQIVRSGLGDRAGVIGTALMVLDELFVEAAG